MDRMKVAYIGYLTQIDTDLSYLQEAQKICDITAYFFVNPKHIKKSILKLNSLYPKTGIFDASIYPEFDFLSNILDLSKIKIVNIADGKHWQFRAFREFYKLARQIDHQYDVVHLTAILQPTEWPLLKLRGKIMLTVHDPLPHSSTIGRKYLWARKLSFHYSSKFLIFNKAQKEDFLATYRIKEEDVIVSRLSTFSWLKALEPFSDAQDYNLPERYILFSGRITEYKGLQYLLPAMKLLHQERPDVKLVVAGGGDFPMDIAEYENLDYIEFRHRFIPDVELVAMIKGCMFAVCPYTDATQSGVVMSTFTFAKPMLATNVGGLPEMVVNGKYGHIIKEKDIVALVQGMKFMLDNPNKLQEYSNNIQRDYNEGSLSWKQTASDVNTDYKSIYNKI